MRVRSKLLECERLRGSAPASKREGFGRGNDVDATVVFDADKCPQKPRRGMCSFLLGGITGGQDDTQGSHGPCRAILCHRTPYSVMPWLMQSARDLFEDS